MSLGVDVGECTLPDEFAQLCAAQKTIMVYEAARTLVDPRDPDDLAAVAIRELLKRICPTEYAEHERTGKRPNA